MLDFVSAICGVLVPGRAMLARNRSSGGKTNYVGVGEGGGRGLRSGLSAICSKITKPAAQTKARTGVDEFLCAPVGESSLWKRVAC